MTSYAQRTILRRTHISFERKHDFPAARSHAQTPTGQQMSSAEVRRKSISLDCDTIYFSDVLGNFRACASGCGSSFYFEDEGDKVTTPTPNQREVCFNRSLECHASFYPGVHELGANVFMVCRYSDHPGGFMSIIETLQWLNHTNLDSSSHRT